MDSRVGMGDRWSPARIARRARGAAMTLAATAALLLPALQAHAQETVCARVKIEIKQELTLERQAFDAEMKISNQLDGASLTDVSVVVNVTDELGMPVQVTDDPNNLNAKFFIRVSGKENIAAVDGTGVVAPSSTATIHWLLIPAPGSAGNSPLGKKYLVGARLTYKFGAETQTLDVSPDVITVKPLPLLTLDYFLQQDVLGDDPLTTEIEAIEPATLGVRVRNTGQAIAKNLKIDSAQPKIVENNQGLLINFKLTGSFVDDAPAQNTLLINFGDIAPATSKMGRWLLETSLAGKFTEFTASFSHADELGGALTSLLQATNAHLLIRDVRVDLPGRDMVRDFLAKDGDGLRVYESDSTDTVVTDRSAVAQMVAGASNGGNANFRISFPATAGFAYVKLPDPFNGTKALGVIQRSDAKQMLPENVWLSKTRNLEAKRWEYWVNIFDVNTTGVYDTEFQAPPTGSLPPVLQFVPDRNVDEEKQVSFLVEASSPGGKPLTLSAAPLPAGATLVQQPADPEAPNLTRAVFDWKPAKGSAGSYLITYTATDGTLSTTRSATIKVNSTTPPPGPTTPVVHAPAAGGQVASLRPTLAVLTSTHAQDPTRQVQFELYRDAAMTQQVDTGTVAKVAGTPEAPLPTTWQPAADLNDNTTYWWRARAFDGTQTYSPWIAASFRVNLFNDAPDQFNLTSPAPNAEVSVLPVQLSWTNSVDRDGDAITYVVTVFSDAALTRVLYTSAELTPGEGGSTTFQLPITPEERAVLYWRVTARDVHGAQTMTPARRFSIGQGNTPPTTPVLVSPARDAIVATSTTLLSVESGTDAENDLISYVFELDTVETFDSGEKQTSGTVVRAAGTLTSWTTGPLVENKRYFWRVKAQDGRTETDWVGSRFRMSAVDDAPPTPTVMNPGDGAWSGTRQPVLEVNPVEDPEGAAVRYEFEVYRDAALGTLVWSGTSDTTSMTTAATLDDATTHWWRARALDAGRVASAWTAPARLYVSTGTYQEPSIQITSPATTITPTVVLTPLGERRRVTLNWTGTDPNIEPLVALYYSTTRGDYAGSVIVDGVRQASGTHSGSHVWDVTELPPGAYYVYGVIHDPKGVGRAFAAGAVVIPNPSPTGKVLPSTTSLVTTDANREARFGVRLESAPTAEVTVSLNVSNARGGRVSPTQLVFTPSNWSAEQSVTVTGLDDCAREGVSAYDVVLSKAVSLDPNYAGVAGAKVTVQNSVTSGQNSATTTNPAIHACRYRVVSERQVNPIRWAYVLSAEWTNTGVPLSSLTAKWSSTNTAAITVLENTVAVGAIGAGETVKAEDTFSILSNTRLADPAATVLQVGRWAVVVKVAP